MRDDKRVLTESPSDHDSHNSSLALKPRRLSAPSSGRHKNWAPHEAGVAPPLKQVCEFGSHGFTIKWTVWRRCQVTNDTDIIEWVKLDMRERGVVEQHVVFSEDDDMIAACVTDVIT